MSGRTMKRIRCAACLRMCRAVPAYALLLCLQICFATEIVTSGTLKEYIARVKRVKLKIIKK